MTKGQVAKKGPFAVQVEAGKEYYWCACGKSKGQPFCDGSHKGSEFKPMSFKASKSETAYFCGCKQTNSPVMCDGTHKTLP